MKSKLYVGNLPFGIEESEIEQLFAESGSVQSITIIKDAFTGKAKGFGFVEMKNQQEASKAIETLDSKEFKGRNLKVNLANDGKKKTFSKQRY